MSFAGKEYLASIRDRAADFLPEIIGLLNAHHRRDDVETAIVDIASNYLIEEPKGSKKRIKESMKRIAKHARLLRGSLGLGHLSGYEKETIRGIIQFRMNPWTGSFGDLFPQHSLQRLGNQLNALDAAMVKGPSLGPTARKSELCKNCLIVFEACRPSEATSAQTGDFRNFVELVFEIATGCQPAKQGAFTKPIKDVLRRFRQLKKKGLSGADLWMEL